MEFGGSLVYAGDSEEEEEVPEERSLKTQYLDQQAEDGQTCMLDIFDTAGQEEFSVMREQYMMSGDGFLVVFDVTNPDSLKEAETIYEWTKAVRNGKTVPAVLCGNKTDLVNGRKVTEEEGEKFARRLGIDYIETSAKTGSNVSKAFETLVSTIARTGVEYKIVVLGSGGVGKSAVTVRYVSDTFVDSYDPTIEDSYRKRVTIQGLKPGKTSKAKSKKGSASDSLPPAQPMQRKEHKKSGFFGKLRRKLTLGKKDRESKARGNTPVHSSAAQAVPDTSAAPAIPGRKIDTNVISLSLGTLSQDPTLVTGDPFYCQRCLAVLSKVSVDNNHLQTDQGETVWNCEFCGHKNAGLEITDGELPRCEAFDFILSAAPGPSEAGGGDAKADEGLVIYCIDISGSMDTQATIPQSQAMWRKMRSGDGDESWRRTRLDCIKEAVRRQMETLQVSNPGKKVVLVTFGSQVWIHDDAQKTKLEVMEAESKSKEFLIEKGSELYDSLELRTITDSLRSLTEIVEGLGTTGSTALGPASSFCVGLASRIPSSEIVLCTDGQPNVGIGSNISGEATQGFYAKLGQTACKNQTVVNVLAVEGVPVGLNYVGKVATTSNGTVSIVSPLEMTRQIRLIAQNPIVARAVSLKIILHPSLKFEEDDVQKDSNELIREVGNVTQESDLTFRYSVRDKETSTSMDSLPFQVQMKYTLLNGMSCLRVITKTLGVTTDREKSEKTVRVAVLGLAAVQRSATLAQNGDVVAAQRLLYSSQRLMQRGAVTATQQEEHYTFVAESADLDSQLQNLRRLQQRGEQGIDDSATQCLTKNVYSNRDRYMAASANQSLHGRRGNYDEDLRADYYGYQC